MAFPAVIEDDATVRAKLILLGVATAALLVAGIALWRMANEPARPVAQGDVPAPDRSSGETEPVRRQPPDAGIAAVRVDAAEVVAGDPPEAPRDAGPRRGAARAVIVLGRLRDAVKRTDAAVTACFTGKQTARVLLQFTAVPVDGHVSIEHAESIPNVGRERTSSDDRTLLDCLAKAHAGTPLSDVGDVPVIIRTRVVVEHGELVENNVISASPQHRGDD